MPEIDRGRLAAKIAEIIEAELPKSDIMPILASIEKINSRLDRIEESLTQRAAEPRRPLTHPSFDRFAFAEEMQAPLQGEKICGFEPHNRPCDHCSMCGSRGF